MNELVPTSVPEREVVAARVTGDHQHIERVKLADDAEEDAATVLAAIKAHEAHYIMRREDLDKPFLLEARQCPDCLEEVLWA